MRKKDNIYEDRNLERKTQDVQLPYFDYLLAAFEENNSAVINSFGRHVHWGYWEHPRQATLTIDDFTAASENLTHQVCMAAKIKDNINLLDVGCGFGGTIAHVNEHYQEMNLVGLNIDERQLERARKLVSPIGTNKIEFKQGNACALPFPDASFDVVLAVECIFHFPDREQFFKEAYRVLKPNGYLAISDFVSKPLLKPFANLKLLGQLSVGFYGQCDFRFSIDDYRKLALKSRLAIQTERDITLNTLPSYRFLRRLRQHYPIQNLLAFMETATAEVLSRWGFLDYYIYGFQK